MLDSNFLLQIPIIPQNFTKAENPVLFQFKVDSREQLEEMNNHLEKQGVKLIDKSKKTSYGLITNFSDPDGNKLEIIYQ